MSMDCCEDRGRAVDTDTDDMAYSIPAIGGGDKFTGVCRCVACRSDEAIRDGNRRWFVRLGLLSQREIEETVAESRRIRSLIAASDITEGGPDDRAAMLHETV